MKFYHKKKIDYQNNIFGVNCLIYKYLIDPHVVVAISLRKKIVDIVNLNLHD